MESKLNIRISRITRATGNKNKWIYFTMLQGLEYYEARFTFADSIYGSTFFIATGFHGLHVVVGTIFLIVT